MRVSVVVVGGGPAGLAMSRRLVHVGVDHVVLERGEVVNSWRRERWDSLRLLTPNWMTQLPGHGYDGADPDGFMTAAEAVAFFDGYRRRFDPPLLTHVTVRSVRRTATGFEVVTDAGHWQCDAVVAATGASSQPRVPSVAADWPRRIDQVTALEYRRPSQFDRDGQVLVVGRVGLGRADRRRASARRTRRDHRGRRAHPRARARTGDATSTGGWTRSVSSTSGTTRSTTSIAPGATRRCRSSATTKAAISI